MLLLVVAFLVALNQNGALLGNNGLLPVPLFLQRVKQHFGRYVVIIHHYHGDVSIGDTGNDNWSLFSVIPTVLWWVDDDNVDMAMDIISWSGLILSTSMIVLGSCNVIISSLLWLLYHSLVNVGQRW